MKNFEYELIDCPECGDGRYYQMNPDCNSCGEYHCDGKNKDGSCCIASCCGNCNEGKIKSDYIIVTKPEVGLEFLNKRVIVVWENGVGELTIFRPRYFRGILAGSVKKIKIHKSIVKEICEPKEGDAIFEPSKYDDEYPEYFVYKNFHKTQYPDCLFIKVNALVIGMLSGELKEFLEWIGK